MALRTRHSNMRAHLIAASALVLAVSVATPARAEGTGPSKKMSLEECVDFALTRSPDLVISSEEVNASLAARRGMRGNFGPKLRAEANVIRWDGPQTIDFGATFGVPMPPAEVREAWTKSFGLTLVQPLASLWSIYEGYKVADLGLDVARIKHEAARRDLAFQVTSAYFRSLQAMRLEEVARISVTQLESQVERARSFYKNGVVAQNDLLRAELGLAAAKQRLIQMSGTVVLAQSQLALTMGLPNVTRVEPASDPRAAGQDRAASISSTEAECRGLEKRVELRELEARTAQARAGVRAAWSKMLPQVNVMARYEHNTGSMFQAEDAYYAGLMASWDLWEWGATYYGTHEAKARRNQALAATTKVRDAIRLEVRAAHVTQATAAEALAVARQAVAQAQENFRLEQRRYESHANTSFDVLDAETQLTQARAQEQTAVFDLIVARAALERAMGETPAPSRARAH